MSRAHKQENVDPAVEEVLASIRQIMANDGESARDERKSDIIAFPVNDTSSERSKVNGKEAEVLTLTNMVAKDGSIIELTEEESQEDILELREDITPHPEPIFTEPQVKSQEPLEELSDISLQEEANSILSPEAVAESMTAFEELNKLNTIVDQKIQDSSFGSKTVEELMRELLRPMLKDWLDSHLPSLVKWLVAEKIEQMIRERQA